MHPKYSTGMELSLPSYRMTVQLIERAAVQSVHLPPHWTYQGDEIDQTLHSNPNLLKLNKLALLARFVQSISLPEARLHCMLLVDSKKYCSQGSSRNGMATTESTD